MNLQDLGQWYYLIYLLPLAISFVMILASALGTTHRGGHGGVRMGHGGHHGIRLGHGVRIHSSGARGAGHSSGKVGGHSAAKGHAARTASHSRAGSSRGSGNRQGQSQEGVEGVEEVLTEPGLNPLLSFFGIGRAPGILLIQGFGLCWGVAGFYASRWYQQAGQSPAHFILPALLWAGAGGVLGSKLMATLSSRLMPSEESFAMGEEDLLGLIGTAVFPVSATMGRVHVYDAYGTLHVESARLCPDETEPITKGESVLLVDYDEKTQCFRVERSPV